VVEQRFCKPLAGGSNPSPGTNKIIQKLIGRYIDDRPTKCGAAIRVCEKNSNRSDLKLNICSSCRVFVAFRTRNKVGGWALNDCLGPLPIRSGQESDLDQCARYRIWPVQSHSLADAPQPPSIKQSISVRQGSARRRATTWLLRAPVVSHNLVRDSRIAAGSPGSDRL
jgi:hypothetical protein